MKLNKVGLIGLITLGGFGLTACSNSNNSQKTSHSSKKLALKTKPFHKIKLFVLNSIKLKLEI